MLKRLSSWFKRKPTVFDVAGYILFRHGEITHRKLQQLVYYSQSWSMVWEGRPIFKEPIIAGPGGPVCIPLTVKLNRGEFKITRVPNSNILNLSPEDIDTIDSVLNFYAKETSYFLGNLVKMEQPWIDANNNPSREISVESMEEYYSSL